MAEELLMEAIERGEIHFEWPDRDNIEAMQKATCEWNKLLVPFHTNPSSLDWYQMHYGEHYLVPWLLEIGKCVYPHLDWKIMAGDAHSLAYGLDKVGSIKCIFDITRFHLEAMDLIHFATLKRSGPAKRWRERETARPIAGFFEQWLEGNQ
jgi:hypothetical protein